ncbi:MAG: CRTAC1 family protein [Terracidiphilus sp.]|nr:CRTAC1 family protein [Terracidiphilus sp.]
MRYSAFLLTAGLLITGLFSFLGLLPGSVTPGPITFEDTAEHAGMRFTATNSATPNRNQIETMLAGVALLDYDGDGLLDVYFANGAAIPSLQKDDKRFSNRLFHNNGDGTFTDVTERAGVAGSGYGMGVAVGDFDNDGRPDIFLANVGSNQLFHNNGDGTFTDVTARAGLQGAKLGGRKMWSVSAGWFDYDNDGYLDLFVSNYCVWQLNSDPYCGPEGRRQYCHPRLYKPLHNTLYHNNGDGTFTDVSETTGIAAHAGKGMGVSFADYDGDGFTDVFVANDTTPNFLFHNLKGQRFEEVGVQSGVAYTQDGIALSGMGSDFRDVDNDGRPDIWHTAVEMEMFPLFLNRGHGQFFDATLASGIGRSTRDMSGWSNGIFDFDNDGFKDLFVARANVNDNPDATLANRQYREPNAVFRNAGNGRFQDVSAMAGASFQIPAAHRGVAFGDLDNDGRIDAVVTVLNGAARLFHNTTANANHWILIKLVGRKSNRMGIGARVKITTASGTQYNHATASVGYACSSDTRVHFGLGASRQIAEIEILWPSGIRQVLREVQGDRVLTVEEPAS